MALYDGLCLMIRSRVITCLELLKYWSLFKNHLDGSNFIFVRRNDNNLDIATPKIAFELSLCFARN